jgi:vancomycin aglycone glucosyltransferase
VRVLLSTDRGRGDAGLLVGLAVRLRALGAEVRVCAPPDSQERPTELETPVIRPASAGQRSTAASEVSR